MTERKQQTAARRDSPDIRAAHTDRTAMCRKTAETMKTADGITGRMTAAEAAARMTAAEITAARMKKQPCPQILHSLTAARRQMVSWRCFLMGMDLSAVKIIFQVKMISMFRLPRSAVLT